MGSGTVDWKNGDTVVQSTGDSIFSWNFTVNCTAFLTGSAGGVQDLYYSIRAKNDAGDVCEWTPARIIKLDEKAPSFENSKVGPTDKLEEYVDNIFVKDGDYLVSEFMSTSGVTKIEITSVPEVSYLAALKTLNGDTAITGAKIYGAAVFTTHSSGGKSGYKMQLPIKTANLNDPDLNFKIKVTLTGGQANGSIPNFNQFVLRYDITKPAAIFGTPKGDLKKLHCTQMAASGVDISIPQNSSVTAEVAKLVKNIDNLYLFAETNNGSAKEIPLQGITEISGKVTVTFKTPPVTGVKADAIGVLIEKDPVVFKPSGSEYQVQGLAYDTGSGVKTVKASIGNKSVDISKFTSLLGSFVSFKESLLINDLPDGSNTLKLAVTDGAGNPGTESNSTVYLRNKPLKLNKVLFSTDLNGNNAYDTANAGVIESVEESGDGKNLDTRQNYVQTLDIAQKFTLKNATKSQIKFTLDAGQSAKNFTMYKVAPTAEDPWALGTLVKSGSLADSSFTNGEINFISTDFGSAANKIPDGDGQKFVIVLKDAASDTDTERKLTLRVTLNVKISDTRQPSVFITPFYWNGEGDNSLASNDRTKGHIEIKKVSTGVDLTGESDVSGQVVLRGTAYHPAKLTKLVLTVDSAVKTATYASGSWSSADGLTVRDKRLDVNGHWVDWEYVWTTGDVGKKDISVKAKHNTVESDAAADSIGLKTAQARTTQSLTLAAGDTAIPGQFIRIVGKTDSADADASYLFTITSVEGSVVKWEGKLLPEVPTAQGSSPAPEDMFKYYYLYPVEYKTESSHTNEPVYNKPTMSVNVVPYITGIVTKLDTAYSSNPSVFNRSAKGEYPVRNDETITVKGFNLAPSSGNPTVSIGTTHGTSTANEIKVKLRSSDKSGNLDITVNGIKSINNLNSNAAYNMKPNGANNDLLNDDTKLHVWKFATVRTDTGVRYPTMRIGKDVNQTVGFVYGSGAQAMKMNLGGQDFGIDFSFTQWYDTGVAVDSSGKIYGAAMNGDSGADGTHSYNKHANFGFYAWNTYNVPGQTYNRYSHLKLPTDNGDGAYSRGLKKVALENSYDGVVFASNRIVSPKIATKGAGNVYMAYYDASQNTVKFRYGNVSGSPDTDGVQLTFSGGLGNHSNNGTGSAAGAVGIASGDTAGPYVAVGVVPEGPDAGRALVAWYDPKNQRLLYKYSTSTSDYSSANWSDENIIDTGFVGWYVDLVADKDGGIHIAYYSAQNGDLKYAYLSKYDATPQTYFVDSYLSVGTNISIEVSDIKKTFTKYKINADTGAITEDGTESRYVPYISSYMSSFMRTQNSVRVAWLADIKPDVIKDNTGKYKANSSKSFADGVKNDKYTGTWEAMTIPTTQIPLDYTVGVGIKKNTSNNQSVMLGYGTTAGLETAILE